MPLNPDIALVKINKEEGKTWSNRQNGRVVNNNHPPQSLNRDLLILDGMGRCAVAVRACIPFNLSVCQHQARLHQSRIQLGLLRARVILPSCWMEASKEPGRWHQLSTHMYVWKETGRKSLTQLSSHKPVLSARTFYVSTYMRECKFCTL